MVLLDGHGLGDLVGAIHDAVDENRAADEAGIGRRLVLHAEDRLSLDRRGGFHRGLESGLRSISRDSRDRGVNSPLGRVPGVLVLAHVVLQVITHAGDDLGGREASFLILALLAIEVAHAAGEVRDGSLVPRAGPLPQEGRDRDGTNDADDRQHEK